MSFCARPRCPDLADEILEVMPGSKVKVPLCDKHAKEWKLDALKTAAKDIAANPPFGSRWNRRYRKPKP